MGGNTGKGRKPRIPGKLVSFSKLKVALNPMYRICFNFAKSFISSCLLKFYSKEKFHCAVFKYKRLKLKLRVFLACHSVAMLTYCVTKISTCSVIVGSFVIQ